MQPRPLLILSLLGDSESVRHRPHFELIGRQTELDWWMGSPPVRSRDVCILSHVATAELPEARLGQRARGAVVRTEHRSEFLAVLEALGSRRRRPRIAAFVSLGFGLAPATLLDRVLREHVAQRNKFTEVVGAPAGVGPLVLDTDLLESIRALDLPYSSGNVGDVLRTVAAIARDSRAGIRQVSGGVFDLTKSYSARAEELPEAIGILTQEDVLVLREVLALRCRTSGRDRSGLGALYAWKRVVLRRANERRSRLLPSPQPSRRRRAPRRVLYVSNNSGFGGAEQALCTLVGAIPCARYEQYALISFPGTFASRMARAGVHVKCATHGFFGATVENCLSVRKAIADFAPEIVHFNGVAGLPALLAAKTLSVPVVQHVRVFGLAGYEDQLDWAERVVAVSEFVAGHLRRRDVQPSKIKVVWDGVEPAKFAARACERERSRHNLRISPGTSLVTVVARHSRSKRQDLAVRAAALAAKRVKNLRLLLVGDSYGETGAGSVSIVVEK